MNYDNTALIAFCKECADAGLPVIPVRNSGNRIKTPFGKWDAPEVGQTSDPSRIESIFTNGILVNGRNIVPHAAAAILDNTPFCIIDLDLDAEEKTRYANGEAFKPRSLCLFENMTEDCPEARNTLTVRTPSGGLHVYFRVPDPIKHSRIKRKVEGVLYNFDVLAGRRFALLPGSQMANGAKYIMEKREKIRAMPEALRQCLEVDREEPEARTAPSDFMPDTENALQLAVRYLSDEAPEAVEGSGGDNTTFQVAARLKDCGCSQIMVYELLRGMYNQTKCSPPWGDADLRRFVKSAFKSGVNEPGCDLPRLAANPQVPFSGRSLQNEVLPEMKWHVPGLIPEGLSLLVGAPKAGKSFLAMEIAVSLSIGRPVFGRETRPTRVLYLALEDGKRRLQKRQRNTLRGDRMNQDNLLYQLAFPRLDAGGLRELKKLIIQERVELVIIDTWQKVRSVDGTGNAYKLEYAEVADLKGIYDATGCSILLLHHFKKRGKMDEQDIMDRISGSTAIAGASDTIMLLNRERGSDEGSLFVTGRDIDCERAYTLIRLEYGGWEMTERSVAVESIGERFTDQQIQLLNVLKNHSEAISPPELASESGLDIGYVKVTVGRWYQSGKLLKVGRGKYILSGIKESEAFDDASQK